MRLQKMLTVGLLGLAFVTVPVLSSTLRADDAPKEAPKHGQHGGPMGMIQKYHDTVIGLNLTDEQKPKVETLFTDAEAKVKDIIKEANGDRDAMREKIGPVVKEMTTKLLEILTPEQQEALKKARPAHKPPGDAPAK